MIKKYGKTYKNILKHKKNFYEQNQEELLKVLKINTIYSKGPKRKNCKICKKKLNKKHDFISFKLKYFFCKYCNHLNGPCEETKKFFHDIYNFESKKKNPNTIYQIKNYKSRVKDIYIPKVNFLKSVVKDINFVLDFGAGAGYFINACRQKKIDALGVENDKSLVRISHIFNKNKIIDIKNYNDLKNKIINQKIDCLSAINVIEHLKDPHEFFNFFNQSKIKYLFISVPLVSFSIFLENVNQDIFPKQLGGGHTHLFSKKSLKYMIKKYKLKIIGEWWFGTDIPDLLRTIYAKHNFQNEKTFYRFIEKYLLNQLDDLQKVFDKSESTQEVHMVLKNVKKNK